MLYFTEVGTHPSPHLLCVVEKVHAMLVVHARDAIQEAALQTQGDGGARGLFDGVACSGDVDALDGFAVQLAAVGVVAEIGDQPVARSSCQHKYSRRRSTAKELYIPHRRHTMFRVHEN